MKRKLVLLLSLVMVLTVFVACSNDQDAQTDEPEVDETIEQVEDNEETEEVSDAEVGEITTIGLGVIADTLKSKDGSEDNPAVAQADITGVAAAFDAEGRIVKVDIDTVQPTVEIDQEGEVTIEDMYLTKKELGPDYGMLPASGIEKEWDEQIAFFENHIIGMTVEEVLAIETDEDSYPLDEDVLTGATMKISGYVTALNKAWENRQDVEGVTRLGLGMMVSPDSKQAGTVRMTTTLAAVGLGEGEEILAAQIDSVQPQVKVEDGEVVETFEEVLTKRELGDDYNMRGNSEIDKEWFEQNAAWAEYMVGKTIDEINGLEYKVVDEGHQFVPNEADIMTEVTITVEPYNMAVEDAIEKAN